MWLGYNCCVCVWGGGGGGGVVCREEVGEQSKFRLCCFLISYLWLNRF